MTSKPVSDSSASERLRQATASTAELVDLSQLNHEQLEEFKRGLAENMALADEEQPWAGEEEPSSVMDSINDHEI